ncbi:MAG: carboxypeptidase-like regulatory domain-containing protein, partial [Planctomycetota bacterium]
LIGQLVDEAGAPVAEQAVTITLTDGSVASVKTNAEGAFAFRGVRGVAQVRSSDAVAVVRAWAPGTAPPNAGAALLLVRGEGVVRGQQYAGPATNRFFSRGKQLMANPLFVAGAIATAVAIPVAIANDDDPAS